MRGVNSLVLLSVCLVLIALSGCIGGAGEGDRFVVPSIESTYEYERDDGATLSIKVVGVDHRYDAVLEPRVSLLLDWTAHLPEMTEPVRFQEAIDEDGRIVQQTHFCDQTREPDQEEWSCLEDRATVILDSMGYPGAFAAAPFWNGTLPQEGPQTLPSPYFAYTDTITLDVTPREDSDCRTVTGPSWNTVTQIAPFRFSVLEGPTVLCPEYELPVVFTTEGRETWRLVDVDNRTGEPPQWDVAAPGPRYGLLERRSIEAPLIAADPTDPSPFTVEDAHEAALERSASYNALFERDGTLLVGAHYRASPEFDEGLRPSMFEEDERTLTAVAPDGESVRVKVVREIGPRGATVYHIEDERTYETTPTPSPQTMKDEQVKIGPAIERGILLTGQPDTDTRWLRVNSQESNYASWNVHVEWVIDDGYIVKSLHEDPNPQGGGGLIIKHPPPAVFHGPTGALLSFSTTEDRIPLHETLSRDQT